MTFTVGGSGILPRDVDDFSAASVHYSFDHPALCVSFRLWMDEVFGFPQMLM